MAPSKMKLACDAMAVMGIPQLKVKSVLKTLLKTYNGKWKFIEEDKYKLLIDAIFEEDAEATQVNNKVEIEEPKHVVPMTRGKKKALELVVEEEEEEADEDEVPLKKKLRTKRKRGCDHSASVSLGSPIAKNAMEEDNASLSLDTCMLEKAIKEEPKLEEEDEDNGMTKLPPLKRYLRRAGGKESADVKEVVRKTLHYSDAGSCSSSVLEMEKSVVCVEKQDGVTINDTTAIYVPPLAAGESSELKAAVVLDLASSNSDAEIKYLGAGNCSAPMLEMEKSKMHVEEGDGEAKDTPNASTALVVLPSPVEDSSGHKVAATASTLELASSTSGEAKISLSFVPADGETTTLHLPSMEDLLRAMEKRLKPYRIVDPGFSVVGFMKDMCNCYSDLTKNLTNQSPETETVSHLAKNLTSQSLETETVSHLAKNLTNQSLETETVSHLVKAGDESDAADNSMGLVVVPECGISEDGWRAISMMKDITAGGERNEIPWVNDFSDEVPSRFDYIPQNFVFQDAAMKVTVSSFSDEQCCVSCIGNCLDLGMPCKCTIPYTVDGVLKDDFLEERISEARDLRKQVLEFCKECPLEKAKKEEELEPCKGHIKRKAIKECWIKCGCAKSCGNRVVQRGIHHKLEVFYTPNGKGWGLRTLERLSKGEFVCEYVGEVLTISELYQRSLEDRLTPPVILDAHWGSQESLEDNKALCLDGTRFGNISRFLNHRCLDANLIEIPVQIETPDHHYYHLAFFTTRDIEPMEELTRDYGIDFDDVDEESPVKLFDCLCGSRFCKNMKRSKKAKRLMIKA